VICDDGTPNWFFARGKNGAELNYPVTVGWCKLLEARPSDTRDSLKASRIARHRGLSAVSVIFSIVVKGSG